MEKLPVVFSQEEMDRMANKPFDVYDNKIRAQMSKHQARLDAIAQRDAEREATRKKWIKNDQAS